MAISTIALSAKLQNVIGDKINTHYLAWPTRNQPILFHAMQSLLVEKTPILYCTKSLARLKVHFKRLVKTVRRWFYCLNCCYGFLFDDLMSNYWTKNKYRVHFIHISFTQNAILLITDYLSKKGLTLDQATNTKLGSRKTTYIDRVPYFH